MLAMGMDLRAADQPLPVSVMTVRLMPGENPDNVTTRLEERFGKGSLEDTTMLKEFNMASSVPFREASDMKLLPF